MRQQRDVETVCQVFLFGLHRVALLIFLKTGLGSLMFREGPVQKCVSTERGEEGSDICPLPQDLCSSSRPLPRPLLLCPPNRETFPKHPFPTNRSPFLSVPFLGFLSLPNAHLHRSRYIFIWFCQKASPMSTQCYNYVLKV